MIAEIAIILALGIMNDVLVTLYYLFVGRLQALPASFLTILITLLNFFVIERIVVNMDWMLMLIYASGSAIGCFSIILMQKAKLIKKTENTAKKKAAKKGIRRYLF